jgi:basic membrane protein A
VVIATAAAVLAVLVTGCGGGGSSQDAASPPPTTNGSAAIKVGLVTDTGGLNDRSFNHLASRGLHEAEAKLGVEGRILISRSNSDYVPNLSTLARQDYDLVIAVGFLMADAVDTVAARFPDTHFAIIDFDATALEHAPPNVEGLLFKEQEAGYLAGYLAGLVVEREGGPQVIAAVGGQQIPPVVRYIAGYAAGAKAANPNVKVISAYSEDFVAQDKCKVLALNQIAGGSRVEFQVAGGCGLGTLDAAKAKHVWGIGVDADQSYLGSHILTSAVKKVDVAVFETIENATRGIYRGGTNSVFSLANDGVGLGKMSASVPKSLVAQVNDVAEAIEAGETVPPTEVTS